MGKKQKNKMNRVQQKKRRDEEIKFTSKEERVLTTTLSEDELEEQQRVTDFISNKNITSDFNDMEELLGEKYQAFD